MRRAAGRARASGGWPSVSANEAAVAMRCFGVRRRVLFLAFAPEVVRDRAWASSRAPDEAPQSWLDRPRPPTMLPRLATKKPSERTDQTAKVPASSDHPDDASLFILRQDGAITRIAFELSGHRLVTSARDGTARIWDAITRRAHRQAAQTLVMVYAAAFDPRASGSLPHNGIRPRASGTPTPASHGNPLEHDDVVSDRRLRP